MRSHLTLYLPLHYVNLACRSVPTRYSSLAPACSSYETSSCSVAFWPLHTPHLIPPTAVRYVSRGRETPDTPCFFDRYAVAPHLCAVSPSVDTHTSATPLNLKLRPCTLAACLARLVPSVNTGNPLSANCLASHIFPTATAQPTLSCFLANPKRGSLETKILRSAKPRQICSQHIPSRSPRSDTVMGRIRED